MLKERMCELINKLKSDDDDDRLGIVTNVIKSSCTYINAVCDTELLRIIPQPNLDRAELSAKRQDADKYRSKIHDGLITNVKILNRLCEAVDLPPIFDGNVENRVEVAGFAMRLTAEFFEGRAI